MVRGEKPKGTSSAALCVIMLVLLLALCLRLLSLQWSPLPYNIDGLTEVRIGEDILRSGTLEFPDIASHSDSYASELPIFGMFSAFVSSAIGVDVISACQIVAAMVGASCVAILLLLFRSTYATMGGSLAASLVMASLGSFVFAAGCSWKETLGIGLMSFVLFSFLKREEPRFRVILIITLPLMVFVHHHSALLALLILTFWSIIESLSESRGRTRVLPRQGHSDAPLLLMAWIVFLVYYWLIDLPYLDYLSPKTNLYLYLAVAAVVLLLGIRMARLRPRPSRHPIGLVVPVVGAILMVYNYYDPIFPGIPAPSALVLIPFLAYLVLVVPAWEGSRIALSLIARGRPMILALILAPLSLIIFAFLRGQDATSHMIIFRTFDFLMIGFAILVGLGFAYLVRGRPRTGVAAGVCLVIICASTLPIAYNSQELFGVQNHTFDFEYDAVLWFSQHDVDSYSSDQRLGETGWRLFDIEYERGLPYDLREGLPLNASSFFVLEEQWSTNGAQEFPFGVVMVDEGTIDDLLAENCVFYVGGPVENNIIGVRSL